MTPPNYASILCTKIGQKKLNGSVSPQNLQKAPKTPIARPSITPILRMDQVSSIYNPGNDFFWREEGPCRARARTSPARPSLGVPPTRCGGFPVTAPHCRKPGSIFKCKLHLANQRGLRQCRGHGNIEIPSGGTPQDVHVFNMAATLEK